MRFSSRSAACLSLGAMMPDDGPKILSAASLPWSLTFSTWGELTTESHADACAGRPEKHQRLQYAGDCKANSRP